MTLRALKPPPPPPLPRISGVSKELAAVQTQVARATEAARKNPENRGVRVEHTWDATIATWPSVATISHKLGRKPIGWRTTGIDESQSIYEDTSRPRTSRLLHLISTGPCTVQLWVW